MQLGLPPAYRPAGFNASEQSRPAPVTPHMRRLQLALQRDRAIMVGAAANAYQPFVESSAGDAYAGFFVAVNT
jgi:hypothetical protein